MSGIFSDQGAHGKIYNGKVTSTTVGTAVPIYAGNVGIHSVIVHALSGNTSEIIIGDSTVSLATGLRLAKGDSCTVIVGNLGLIYMDVQTSGDGLTYLAS